MCDGTFVRWEFHSVMMRVLIVLPVQKKENRAKQGTRPHSLAALLSREEGIHGPCLNATWRGFKTAAAAVANK